MDLEDVAVCILVLVLVESSMLEQTTEKARYNNLPAAIVVDRLQHVVSYRIAP